jgi:hypothetical protein
MGGRYWLGADAASGVTVAAPPGRNPRRRGAPVTPCLRWKGRTASCIGPCFASSVLGGWAEEGERASYLHCHRRCSSPSAPPRAVGAQARHGLPPVGSAPGPTGAAARGLGSASSARPPPPSSRTASHRCHASRPLSCADPGRQDLRDAMELLCIVPCAAPWGSSVVVAANLPRWCGLTSSSHGGALSSSCVETVGGGTAREGQGGGPGEARRRFAE